MSLKRWLPLVGALGLMVLVVGAAAGATNSKSKTRTVTRACFWVESKGDRVTHNDVKISRLNRSDTRFCIVGKPGPRGRSVRGSAGQVGPVGPQGVAGAMGAAGPVGAVGPQGEIGLQGVAGPQGEVGPQGGQGVQGESGPQGEIGPAGPAGAQGPAGPEGPAGPAGPQGPKGEDGLNGSTIITVDVSDASGQKTKIALCPLTPDPDDDPDNRLFAISGGFSAQGSVTESFRNADGHGWTVTQSSGNTDSLHVFAYCA